MKMAAPAASDTGDDRAVVHVILNWAPSVPQVLKSGHEDGALGTVWRASTGVWELVFAVSRGNGARQRHFVAIDPDGIRDDRWRLNCLGPTVWNLTPSLHVPGQIHAYVTLVGVPPLAPWEG